MVSCQCGLIYNRQAVYKSTLRAFQIDSFSYKLLSVHFSGEYGVDQGGPGREYLRLLIGEISKTSLFTTDWFAHDISALQSNKYELAGMLTAWSVLQGGPGLNRLSVDLYYLMSGIKYDQQKVIQLAQPNLKVILMTLYNCDSEGNFIKFKEEYSDEVADIGYSAIYIANLEGKESIMDCLLTQTFVYSVHAEIQQYFKGMNPVGNLGDLTKGNSDKFSGSSWSKSVSFTVYRFQVSLQNKFFGTWIKSKDSRVSCCLLF